jgi:hypothetical protein
MKEMQNKFDIPFFVSMATAAKFVQPIAIVLLYFVPLDVDVNVVPNKFDQFLFIHPTPLFWYLGFHGNAILNLINTPKASTHYGEYSYDVS